MYSRSFPTVLLVGGIIILIVGDIMDPLLFQEDIPTGNGTLYGFIIVILAIILYYVTGRKKKEE